MLLVSLLHCGYFVARKSWILHLSKKKKKKILIYAITANAAFSVFLHNDNICLAMYPVKIYMVTGTMSNTVEEEIPSYIPLQKEQLATIYR